jgi:phospholipid transport system transporter-binding protein
MKQSKRKREGAAPADEADGTTEPVAAPAGDTPQASARLYALQSSCTVRDSVALRQALLDLIDDPLPVTLDVRAVERVDTAAMQVLCAFVRDRAAAGRVVSWLGGPESFVEAVSLLGMSKTLGLRGDVRAGAPA